MQKKLLATLVASLVAGQAMALEVYNDDVNSLSIGGKIGAKTMKSNGSDAEMKDASPRINFKYAHKFSSGWTGSAVAEWGFYAVDGDQDDQFFNRLGNVGLSHDTYGAFTAGKAWSVTSDVSGWTDQFAIGGGAAMGVYSGRDGLVSDDEASHGSGDSDGTARADDVIQYRNSFGGLNVGIQYQLKGTGGKTQELKNGQLVTVDGTRDSSYGVALSYDLPMGLSLGATYNEAKYAEELGALPLYNGSDKSTSATVGAKYENEALYLAATYGQFENKTAVVKGTLDKESTGIELYGKLALPQVVEGFYLQSGFNQLTADDTYTGDKTDAQFSDYMVGAIYETGPMQFAFEYTRGEKVAADGSKDLDDTYAVQALYYF
ncbi:porin [Endozoicomonas sp. SESOKO2]|uniref:porin n=1 Tax=Endozoicomonas sp. SESOKO2 TaxID=2828743 RepID=UPI002148923F|nr:porin [Endozoicomonas sp. SESOKO2]